MKKWGISILLILIGFFCGYFFVNTFQKNDAVVESLTNRTNAILKVKGISPDMYSLDINKGFKFDGMYDYSVKIFFKDDPNGKYSLKEGTTGQLFLLEPAGSKYAELFPKDVGQ